MFKRPGRQLKVIAVIIFIFFVILGIIVGFLAAAGLTYQAQEAQIPMLKSAPSAAVVIIVCAIVGVIMGWINGITLYCVGSLVDDVELIRKSVAKPDVPSRSTWIR